MHAAFSKASCHPQGNKDAIFCFRMLPPIQLLRLDSETADEKKNENGKRMESAVQIFSNQDSGVQLILCLVILPQVMSTCTGDKYKDHSAFVHERNEINLIRCTTGGQQKTATHR